MLPNIQCFNGNNKSRWAKRVIGRGDSLSNELNREMGISAEKSAVESKCGIRPYVAETDNFNPDRNILVIPENIKGAHIQHMPLDALIWMLPVILYLKCRSLASVVSGYIFMKFGIWLEKAVMFHYNMYVGCSLRQAVHSRG